MHALGVLGALCGMMFAAFALLAFLPEEGLIPGIALGLSYMMMMGLLVACAPPAVAALLPKRQTVVPVAVDAEEGLTIGQVRLSSQTIGTAWLKRTRLVEVLTVTGDELLVQLVTPDAARRLVSVLRARLGRRRAYPVRLESDTLRLTRKTWAWLAPMSLASVVSWLSPAALLTFVPAVLFAGWASRGTHRARFGADGVEVERRGRTRFVAYKDIEAVESRGGLAGTKRISLTLRDGRSVPVGSWVAEDRARLVVALLEEGVAMAKAGAAAGAHVTGLQRDGEETEAWRARVAGLIGSAGYRGVAVEVERLDSIMRNPSAAPEQRVAAALALREEPQNLTRIRVAASVSTEPDVREALEELAHETLDEARLSQVLRRL